MVLYTSNVNKQIEFKSLFGTYPLKIENGEYFPEILGTIDETIIYKSLDFGDNSIVEDTTAIINGDQYPDMNEVCSGKIENGKIIVEIKHKYKELKTGDFVKSISSLAINRNGEILVFRGTMYSVIDRDIGSGELDSFMIPIVGEDKLKFTMDEFRNKGLDYLISWRSSAVRNFLRYESIKKGSSMTPYMYDSCQPSLRIKIKDIPKWTGKYQD